jgi:TRAP-type C4-dicarboxylate transport system substrate-binding protein
LSVSSAGFGGAASAKDGIALKASLFPPPANGAVKVIKAWGQDLTAKTARYLSVDVFPSSQMGPPNRQYDLARDGVADLSWVLHGFTPGRFPLVDIANLPGMFPSSAVATSAMWRVREPLVAEHKGVRVLGLVASTPLVFMTKSRPVLKVADIKGLRVRPPSAVTAGAIQALGGVSVAVPPAEMGDALSKGVIDAIVTTAEAASSFKLFETLKFISDVNMGMATFAFVMNPGAYGSLPAEPKSALDALSGKPFEQRMLDEFEATEAAGRGGAKKDGVEIVKPDDKAQAEFDAVFKQHREKVVAKLTSDGVKDAAAVYSALLS